MFVFLLYLLNGEDKIIARTHIFWVVCYYVIVDMVTRGNHCLNPIVRAFIEQTPGSTGMLAPPRGAPCNISASFTVCVMEKSYVVMMKM